MALKHIGLGLIKMQYFEYSHKTSPKETLTKKENGVNINGIDLWKTAWTDEMMYGGGAGLFRHLLESRYEKTYKCITLRSRYCQNPTKMTRINWMHHVRRGHFKIISDWKKVLRRHNPLNIDNVLRVYCSLCKNRRKMYNSFNPSKFASHMKTNHPQFTPFNDYSTYFERCFICNDQTKSYDQNIDHRKICLNALLKDPNQAGTELFNNCFEGQRSMTTFSLTAHVDDFEMKLKLFNSFKATSLFYWLQLRNRTNCQKPVDIEPETKRITNEVKKNGQFLVPLSKDWSIRNPISLNVSLMALRHSVLSNRTLTDCRVTMSDRIAPGKMVDTSKLHRFILPVPFLVKNDDDGKLNYSKWRRSVRPEYGSLKSVEPWYCEICNAMLTNIKSAYCHIKMCHHLDTISEASCKSCNRRFLTTEGYKNHFQGTKKCPVARKCVACKVSVAVSDIYEHIFLEHKDDMPTLMKLPGCLICCLNVDNIENHLFTVHGMSNVFQGQSGVGKVNYRNGSFFNCPKCSLTYFSEVELRNHMITRDHYLECPDCPLLRFYFSWELVQHKSVFHKSDDRSDHKYECYLCNGRGRKGPGRVFTDIDDKIRHLMKVHLTPCSVQLKDVTMNE